MRSHFMPLDGATARPGAYDPPPRVLVVLLATAERPGDHRRWIDKIKASLRKGGLFVLEGWAKSSPDSPVGFGEGQLEKLFDGYEILRDETVEDVPGWAWDNVKLARFVARKK